MKTALFAIALAGLALPSMAGLSVFDLAAEYTGTWVDPNFTDGSGDPVGGSLSFTTSIADATPGDPGDEIATWTMVLGGNPGGGPLPSFSLDLAVNAQGLIEVSNVEMPDLDGDVIFNTGGDFFETPTLDVSYAADGSLVISATNAAAFASIEVYGTLTSGSLLLTADIHDVTGAPISLGSTLAGTAVPGGSSLLTMIVAGGILRRRRPA